AEAASTYTVGNIFLQLFFDILDPNNDADRLLDGPTNDVWINPWLEHLRNAGVEYHLNARVVTINCDDEKVVNATIEKDGHTITVSGDYYICALPVEVMAALISEPMIKIDRTLADVRKLGAKVEWMNGLQIYLKRDVEIIRGHLNYVDSPWALTSVSQRQFWSKEFDLTQYGDGTVRGIISVDISDWDTKGLNGLTAKECTKQQIFEEIWNQLKKSLNIGGAEILRDEDVHSYHLDPDIVFENGPDDPAPENKRNTEPLLVNLVNTWGMRPEAYTRIPNLFLASDYVRTNTDLATMEAANEAARRAVNSIIYLSGSKVLLCKIWTLHEPEIFAFWREQDRRRFANGLPWREGFLLIELSSLSFWLHLIKHLYVRLRTRMRKWQLGR
ncbi:MAG: FAD-dependent oxidoreductase, partial [bacterium]